MYQLIKRTMIVLLLIGTVFGADLLADRKMLHDSLIRLHVVGASNDESDQNVKLSVRDAVNIWIENRLENVHSPEEARTYLENHLEELETVANETLEQNGVADRASISFLEEAFPTRQYETFSLPAGVYHALRIRIGEARGRNWWCVVFPSLCLGATTEEFQETAVTSGFDAELSGALSGRQQYEIRFFFLDCLGMLENFFHGL